MKIIFISFYSGHVSRGAETFVDQLASNLSFENQVILIQSGKVERKNYAVVEIKSKIYEHSLPTTHILRRLFLTKRHLSEFFFYLKSIPVIIKQKPEVLMPLNSGLALPILKLISIIFKIKLVISAQSGIGWDDRFNLLFKPDLFVCLTNTQLNWAKNIFHWKGQKFVVIGNGVNTDLFSPNGYKVKLNLQKPVIGIAAASEKYKRIENTIKAVSKLTKGSLLLLGRGSLDQQIDKLGSTLLGEQRFLHKNVPFIKMPAYLRSCDVFTLCSENTEAFGTVYLEALAIGLPIVATDDSSRREIMGNFGIYVKNPNDPEEYSKKLKKALQISLSKKINDGPLKEFSTKVMAEKYQDAFQKI